MDTIQLTGPGNVRTELRGSVSGDTVTLERRTDGGEWIPLTIGDFAGVLSSRNGIFPWLERSGILWGAWVGRGAHEIASFKSADPIARRPRPRKSPALRVRSSRLAQTA